MTLEDRGLALVRSAPLTTMARRFTARHLRILGYHGVSDPGRFDAQMCYVAQNYTSIDEQTVAAALRCGATLPEGAVWITFDDGDPSVIEHGLPALQNYGLSATMFVCPGLIERDEPFWWCFTDWVETHGPEALRSLGGDSPLTEHLKTIPDQERRSIVKEAIATTGSERPSPWRQLADLELRQWLDAGMGLGNHTWDHPCLDMCNEDVQRAQVRDAHEWLVALLGRPPTCFAYPNGNFSNIVDSELRRLGYQVGVLYDHRLTRLSSPPLQLSRLMVESNQRAERLIGVLSGLQPALRSLVNRIRL